MSGKPGSIQRMIKIRLKLFVNIVFEFINRQFFKLGFTIKRNTVIKIDKEEILEGRSFLYRTGIEPIYTSFPLEKARINGKTLVDGDNCHINIIALKKALSYDDQKIQYQKLEETLIEYASTENKKNLNLNRSLGLSDEESRNLSNIPSWAKIYPWNHTESVQKQIATTNFSTFVENSKRRGPRINAMQGGAQYPLVSKERAAFEAKLLFSLYNSIKSKGYIESKNTNYDPVGAIVAIDSDSNWCWAVSAGIHRCCVLSLSNIPSINVMLKKVIYKEDVESWPNVRNGLYTKEAALKVFDHMFDCKDSI